MAHSVVGTASPIESISGVWKFTRGPGGFHLARSLPGHLLHLVLSGGYRLRTNGREYDIKTHDIIYYHETEDVEWLGNTRPVEFLSAGFLAASLEPLPPERRVFPSPRRLRAAFGDLYAASLLPQGAIRALRLHEALLRIVLGIEWWRRPSPVGAPSASSAWHDIERLIRERRLFRPTLDELAAMVCRSRASVVRDCRSATGMSPMQRLREVRMAEARGLLLHSHLSVTQVSEYLGYPRPHEFSREFRRFCGASPGSLLRGRLSCRPDRKESRPPS